MSDPVFDTPPLLRSLQDRMTNPAAEALQVAEYMQILNRPYIEKIVNHLGYVLEHMANKRPDLMSVTRTQDTNSYTIRVELSDNPLGSTFKIGR